MIHCDFVRKERLISFIWAVSPSLCTCFNMLIWSCLSWFCICNESRSVTRDAILAFSSPVKTEGEDGWSRGPPFPEVSTTTSSLLPPADAPMKVSNVEQMDISSNMEVSAPRPIKKPANTGSFVKPTHPAGGRRPKNLRMNHWWNVISFVFLEFIKLPKTAFLHVQACRACPEQSLWPLSACTMVRWSAACCEKERTPCTLANSEHEFHSLSFICHAHAKHKGEYKVSSVVYLKFDLRHWVIATCYCVLLDFN